MSALLIARKNILKTISGLILANKKLFLKNFTLLFLFDIEKVKTIIP